MVRTGLIGKCTGTGWKLISVRKSWIEVSLMTLTVRARESVGVVPSRSVVMMSLVIVRIISVLADIKLRVTHTPGFWLTVKRPLRIIIIMNILYEWLKIVILSLVKGKV